MIVNFFYKVRCDSKSFELQN